MAAAIDEKLDEVRHLRHAVGEEKRGVMKLDGEGTAIAHGAEIRLRERTHDGDGALHGHVQRWRVVCGKGMTLEASVRRRRHLACVPDVVHRASRSRAENPAAVVLPAVECAAPEGDQPFCDLVGLRVGVAHLRGRLRRREDVRTPGVIGVEESEEFGQGDEILLKDQFAHRGERIDRHRDAGAVDAEVVVLRAPTDVSRLLDASRRNHRHERSRQDLDMRILLHQRVRPPLDFRLERPRHVLECPRGFGDLAEGRIERSHERDRVDVVDVHSASGNQKLPAGGDGIIERVLGIVSPLHQRRNHDVVVRVLGKAESLLRQRRAEFVDVERCLLVDAQIDFRIDELQFAARLEAEARERVESTPAARRGARPAAQHHALPVVALLHTDVEIAVAVARDEELLHFLKRGLGGQASRLDVRVVVREEVLVDASEAAVVFPFAPHRVMEDAQAL